MKTKTFDAVQMKRRGAEKLREQLEALTSEEELAFWRAHTDALRKRQQAIQERHSHTITEERR